MLNIAARQWTTISMKRLVAVEKAISSKSVVSIHSPASLLDHSVAGCGTINQTTRSEACRGWFLSVPRARGHYGFESWLLMTGRDIELHQALTGLVWQYKPSRFTDILR